MPSKYSRKNRDRKGGHKGSPLIGHKEMMGIYIQNPDQNFYASNITRAYVKKITKKTARRQHAQIIAEGLKDYEQQETDAVGYFWGMLPNANEFMEAEKNQEDYDYSPFDDAYYDDYSYLGCDCHECSLARIGRQTQARLQSETVSNTDAGKSIAALLEERGFRL